jgi:hypothetical protein
MDLLRISRRTGQDLSVVRIKTIFLTLWIGSYIATSSKYFHELQRGGDSWKTGDWLINYSGGYVRRGLLGEIILCAHDLTGFGILKIVFIVQMIFFSYFAYSYGKSYWLSSQNLIFLSLIFSPAILFFYILDPAASFRKEIIGYSLIAFAINTSSNKYRISRLVIINTVYALLVFSWEAGVVFLFPILYILNGKCGKRKELKVLEWSLFVSLILISIASSTLSILYPGSPRISGEICSRLQEAGISGAICGGAIFTLSISLGECLRTLGKLYQQYNYIQYFLVLVPTLIASFWWSKSNNKRIIILIISPFALLFVTAWDYGRWINMILVVISYIFLSTELPDSGMVVSRSRVSLSLVLVLSSLFWGMSHYAEPFIPSIFDLFLKWN